MNRILDIGHPLRLGNNEEPFIIKGILGKGASSVTYLAECNQTEHVLKECNPLGLHMHRDDTGTLIPDTKLNEDKFKECLDRFENGVKKQLAFRMTENLKNSISNVQKIYHANGTTYIDMTYFKGWTYDQVEFESLFNVLKRMKALAKIVDGYHKEGYLHLDIKPQNIYAIPETAEMVMMFDFDSVVSEADVEKTVLLSYTDSWAAPEQKMAKYRKSICKATDLFAIVEIIFHRVMGRHSNADERFDFSKYAYDRDAKIFENVNSRVFSALDKLFRKTLCCAPANRIQTAKELITLLDEIIPLADPKAPYLITTLPTPKEFFIGRDAEIKDIHARLQQSPVLFLHGIGGIGKSELAKQYAKKYQSEYDTIIFAPYVIDMASLIANDSCIQINSFSQIKDEKSEEYYERKLRKIKELIANNGDRILLIVDNLDTTEDQNIKLLFELGCRVLITSRVDMGAIFKRPQLEINAINDLLFARELFAHYYHFADAESDDVDAIIKLVQGHTLAIELIAKQIDAEWSTIQKIREKLENGGLSAIGDEVIDNAKDDLATQDSAFGHIKALFDLSIFEKSGKDDELYVLANLSLMPFTGVDRRLFAVWCDLDNHGGKTCLNNLIKAGWITLDGNNISLHPIVADVVLVRAKDDSSTCFSLLTALSQSIADHPNAGLNYTKYGYIATCVLCNRGMCPKELPPLITKLSGIVIGYNVQSELLKMLELLNNEYENNINYSEFSHVELYLAATELAEKLANETRRQAEKCSKDGTKQDQALEMKKLAQSFDEQKSSYIESAMDIISNFIKHSDANLTLHPLLLPCILHCLFHIKGHEKIASFISLIWDFLLKHDNNPLTARNWHDFGMLCQYNQSDEIAYKALNKAKDAWLCQSDCPPHVVIDCYRTLGVISQNDYAISKEHLLTALKLCIQQGEDTTLILQMLINLGKNNNCEDLILSEIKSIYSQN